MSPCLLVAEWRIYIYILKKKGWAAVDTTQTSYPRIDDTNIRYDQTVSMKWVHTMRREKGTTPTSATFDGGSCRLAGGREK